MPEKTLQDRWFAEPLHYLTIGAESFQMNRAGHPALGKSHQDMINGYMRLKNTPWMILCDVGPDSETLKKLGEDMDVAFPTLAESTQAVKDHRKPNVPAVNVYISYMRYLERQQAPYSAMESTALMSFQDWLQSPLQPLSDNLESATYEMFESDPVKYDQYELAITEAMLEWKELKKPTSSVICEAAPEPELVVTVAGAGRGPLVTRVLRSADRTGTKIQLWALEKNHNAYVYLLRQNKIEWDGRVTVVKTDMRGWEGPRPKGSEKTIGKVDILVSELLGSFGDNELSPECLDGVQRHIARPHGISIPHSYTAHLSPIATPRIHADLSSRGPAGGNEAEAFEIPWVTRLFALDFVAAKGVPGHPRFQQAWEFVHPVEVSRVDDFAAERGLGARFAAAGYGSMFGAGGANEHNARHCHLTFVCQSRGVMHGLAGYFESTLYAPQVSGKDLVEISILPEQIDRKSKDMVSWFPIFFPIKVRYPIS
jgi:protein arginine N-methyltransferase 5